MAKQDCPEIQVDDDPLMKFRHADWLLLQATSTLAILETQVIQVMDSLNCQKIEWQNEPFLFHYLSFVN